MTTFTLSKKTMEKGRRSAIGLFILGILMAAGGVFLTFGADDDAYLLTTGVFSLICGVPLAIGTFLTWMKINSNDLVVSITETGVEQTSQKTPGRNKHIAWQDVKEATLTGLPAGPFLNLIPESGEKLTIGSAFDGFEEIVHLVTERLEKDGKKVADQIQQPPRQ